jgi:8-hydroxy-5-deazaflavin:NADPH oxidoreductase
VMLGSRDPSQAKLAEWTAEDPQHRHAGDLRSAAEFGELVIIAVPGRTLPEMLDTIGRDALSGKAILDVTNPFAKNERGETISAYGDDDSGAEYLQREVSDASVVKAFNQILWSDMLHPERSAIDRLRIAGDDDAARRQVTELAESLGWPVRDLGALKKARALERGVLKQYS